MKSTTSTAVFAVETGSRIREGSRNLDTPAEGKEVRTEGSNQTTRRVLPWPAEAMSAGLMRELGRTLQEEIEARV